MTISHKIIFIYKTMKNKILEKLKNNNIIIKEDIIINDNNETITSRIDGTQRKRIFGRYLKRIGLTSDEYKILFPGAPLMCKKDLENLKINSGKHMKEDKYKKMFSEKMLGKKNPNHKSNTTEIVRKERSPFSDEFYKKKYKNIKETELKLIKENFIKDALKDREFNTRIEYYINRGFNPEESKQKLKKRQTTFSMKKCINKYGEIDGLIIFNDRQNKWSDSLNKNGNIKSGYSKISQELFYSILNNYEVEDREHIFFATKNNELKLNDEKNYVYMFDYADIKNKKIIEYNGDCYHANPKLYKKNDCPNPFKKNLTSEKIWIKDNNKLSVAKENGFDVLIIWDSEYKKNKDEIIKKCYDFLFNKKINKLNV